MRRIGIFQLLTTLVILFALSTGILEAAGTPRLRYLGSSNISLPTAYMMGETSYINDAGHNMVMYTQKAQGKLMELSLLRHLNGAESGKNVINFKLNILEEDRLIPNIAWGVGDAGMTLGSRVFYFAGSKTFEAFAATLHGGIIKDPVTTDKKTFVGVEKTILPLVIIAGEHVDGQTSYGVKMRPYPGVSLEYARRDDDGGDDDAIYKLQYIKSF
ncbi:MAG: hypothetical protein BWY66_00705 [bacterium ADurb.Bin374]|nr:MAG: hypothetical protein BWY66_00705 [bacterium ADurb.Bin374]